MNDEEIRELRRQTEKMNEMMRRISGDRPVLSFKEFALTYLAEKQNSPSLRKSTKSSFYHQTTNLLVPGLGGLSLDKVTNAAFLAWVAQIQEESTSGRRVRKITRFFNARKALIEIMLAAKKAGHIEKLPEFDSPDQPRDVGRVLTDGEVIKILWNAQRPFRVIFYAFWKMGCRPREILQWEWSMIKWNQPSKTWIDIPARISKCNRSRSIPINPGLSKLLHIRFLKNRPSPFVFPSRDNPRSAQKSYNAAWVLACKTGGVAKTVPYDFRRTFITRCAIEGKPLIYVAKALDTSTTMIEKIYAKGDAKTMEDLVR